MLHVHTWSPLATGDGNRLTSWAQAAPWLDYALTKATDSPNMRAVGIQTVFYTPPNREGPGDPMYTNDESTFAHDCAGNRIQSLGIAPWRFLMDPHSNDLGGLWQNYVSQVWSSGAGFNYVFEDKADDISKTSASPCNFDQNDWTNASNQLDSYVPQNIIYNSLSHTGVDPYGNPMTAPSIALNATSAGGESEDCYVRADGTLRTKVQWQATELTEIEMAQQAKLFVCNSTYVTPGAQAIADRLYLYASYLLTYDPNTTLIEMQFTTFSGLSVFPETELVAKQPVIAEPSSPSGLLQSGGAYGRQYKQCYVLGVYVGPCAAVVNSNAQGQQAVPFPWPSTYHHTLFISGGGVLDGGAIYTTGGAPPATLPSSTGVIAFQ